ncbi:hypothetical protein KFL_000960010, partial [Klebsormidium nitens]
LSASQSALLAESSVHTQRAVQLQEIQSQYVQAKKSSLASAWEAYKETHATALRERKLLLYIPYQSGQGNRLLGIVTAFMLALISHRALLIDYCKCIHTLDTCKCQWGDLFNQQDIELDAVSLMEKDSGLKITIRDESLTQVDFVYDALDLNLADLADRPVVWGNGSMDWTAHLWLANPHHRETLRALFRPGYVFHDVAQLLMRPSKALRDVRDHWVETRFRPLTIGVHVRMMSLGRLVQKTDPQEYLPHFMHLASSIALLTQPEELVYTNQTAWEGLDRETREGLRTAVLEMLLLGASDEIIGTRASTFSHVAAAFGG